MCHLGESDGRYGRPVSTIQTEAPHPILGPLPLSSHTPAIVQSAGRTLEYPRQCWAKDAVPSCAFGAAAFLASACSRLDQYLVAAHEFNTGSTAR